MRARTAIGIAATLAAFPLRLAAARPLILPTPTPTPAPWEEPDSSPAPSPTVSSLAEPSPAPSETPAPWESSATEGASPPPVATPSPIAAPASPLEPRISQDPVYLTADLLFGSKQLSAPGYPVPSQGELGLALTLAPRDWPVALALDGLASAGQSTPSSSGEKYEASTATWAIGARKVFELPSLRPFLGVGGEWLRATTAHLVPSGSSTLRLSDGGGAFGPWAEAGGVVRLGRMFQLGIYTRYDAAWVTVGGQNLNAGGVQLGAVFGVGMGSAAIPAGVPLL